MRDAWNCGRAAQDPCEAEYSYRFSLLSESRGGGDEPPAARGMLLHCK